MPKCDVCGSEVKEEWEFCSRCGAKTKKMRLFAFGLEDVFKQFGREFERIEKEMRSIEREFGVIDLSQIQPMLRAKKPGVRGFTIQIQTKTGERPKIDIKTFGDVKKEEITKSVSKQLGVRPEEVKILEQKIPVGPRAPPMKRPAIEPAKKETKEEQLPTTPLVTEEPRTNVMQMPGKLIVEIELPGVKKEEDIEIREYEESAEVKARAKDKVYLKIITLPKNLTLAAKKLKDSKLRLEFGYF